MKIKVSVDIKPFSIPNFVVSKEDADGLAKESFPLNCLDRETIEKLCSDFRDGVFKKAELNQQEE